MGGPIRLDIGSGDKQEAGWVRVDFELERPVLRIGEQARAGGADTMHTNPDIACDIRQIPLPEDFADEARAIHVIEHFYPWETVPLLHEWLRVLKPGAQLSVECPCFEKIIALAQVPQIPPNYTHWGLFGDPRYSDPLMMHKWCFTQKQLLRAMQQAGFEDVKPEPPKFHVPIRDMRVVGTKPVEHRIITNGTP